MDELAGRLGTTGTNLAENTRDVESGLAEEAEMGLLYDDSRAHPVRYYFVFRDVDHEHAEAEWKMAVDGLHGPDGLPSLVLVRLNGAHRPEETDLQRNLVHLLKPRS